MPELPEVETIRRTLQERVLNLPILATKVLYPRLLQNCTELELAQALYGRAFKQIDRRGKYLIFHLDSEDRVVFHLRMTGKLVAVPWSFPMEKHTSLQVILDRNLELRLVDQRKFATMHLLQGPGYGIIKGLATMGEEPLSDEFTPDYLLAQCRGRKAPIKSVILDQRRIGGLGNIYADESLYRARIFPGRPAGSLTPKEIHRLHASIQAVIQEGIAYRGTTFRDYVDGDGRVGGFQERLQVYGREGQACLACGESIHRIRIAGRSSSYCPNCQI